ncbi:unnamed protein product [Closterium sp. NIES-53]
MHSRLLVFGIPRSLPPLLPSPAPPCLPCVKGRQRAAPHSSSFPPTTAPLHNLHLDVWGPARINGQGHKRYFLLVVDDYMRTFLSSLDFNTAFLQGSLHEEIWLRRPPGFTRLLPIGIQWSLRRPVYGLRQAPREWHDTLRTTLAALGFTPSTADLSLFLRTDTSLSHFYVLLYVNDLVFAVRIMRGMSELGNR